ncbi:MAG: hypothetical protein ACRD9Q_05240, partial [Nitrososphaeraceae archaeon]
EEWSSRCFFVNKNKLIYSSLLAQKSLPALKIEIYKKSIIEIQVELYPYSNSYRFCCHEVDYVLF